MKQQLQSVPIYSWLVTGTAACGLAAGVTAAFEGGERLYWPISRAWARGLLLTAGIKHVHVRGLDKVDPAAPCILMSNHESLLDPPLLIAEFGRALSFLTKKELFQFPIFGWAMKRIGHIPIDRAQKDSAFASIDAAAGQVAEGRAVMVFPEGTRSRNDDLLPFKKGGFVLAIKSGAPIYPIGVAGTRTVLPPGPWLAQTGGEVALVIGDPIDTSAYTLDTKDALMERVRAEILALRAEARALVGGC